MIESHFASFRQLIYTVGQLISAALDSNTDQYSVLLIQSRVLTQLNHLRRYNAYRPLQNPLSMSLKGPPPPGAPYLASLLFRGNSNRQLRIIGPVVLEFDELYGCREEAQEPVVLK
jgi:hypothetical protein